MVLAQSDENIKYLNASLVAKLRDYNIIIPSFTIPDVLTQQGFRNAMKEVPFNDNGWIEDTLNCLNIGSASCRGCNQRQTDYGQCNAGCFGANTCGACVGACNGGDAVCISCHGATDDSEVYICESCDTGCEGCNETCYGCNEGCQGAQTCATCNTGLPGAPCEYTAGCENCQGDYTITQPTWGCTDGCNSACVSPDSCGTGQVPIVDGCTNVDSYTESKGCTSDNNTCVASFFGGVCLNGYTHKGKEDRTCPSNYKAVDDSEYCQKNYNTTDITKSCASNFITDSDITCIMKYSQAGTTTVCSTGFSIGSNGQCQSGYAGSNTGITCMRNFVSPSGTSCEYKYNITSDGDKSCSLGYITDNGKCIEAYASTDSGTKCATNYMGDDGPCLSGYGLPTCSSCNAAANDTCLNCVSTQATCTSCVSGEAASCTSCVSEQGCTDCQGCDSGCNKDVSCNGYSVGENNTHVCVGNFTDTTCSQTCVGGFDSSTQCLSGQGCASCDTCQGCNSCQGGNGAGCTSCDSGCNTCDKGCYNTCNSCQGCVHVNCTGNWGVCGQIVPPPPSTGE